MGRWVVVVGSGIIYFSREFLVMKSVKATSLEPKLECRYRT